MSSQTTTRTESDEEFLDRALERALEALEDGREPTVEELLDAREHLRAEVDSVLRMATQLAQPRPSQLPHVRGYTLVAELGRGGMGAVYLAHQEALGGRRVALKILPAGASVVASSRERFLREARALASLRHPHVVTVHDVIVEDGCWAYTMEWIDGPSLAEILDALKAEAASRPDGSAFAEPDWSAIRRLMPGLARTAETWAVFVCKLGVAIARALGELHRAGLVHRDVKPGNVLLRAEGTPLLSDFGLVHAAGRELTHGGHFLGTLDYAPPEQLSGDPQKIDARADVYALGVTLYHALTLRLPFDSTLGRRRRATSPSGMLQLIESGRAAPLRTWNRRLPRDLETILAKAIDAERDRRYASADELADDLERLLSLQPIRARPAGPATRAWKLLRRHRAPALWTVAGGAVSLALALSAMVYVFLMPRWVEAHVREARLALMDPLQANLLFVTTYWGPTIDDGSAVPERSRLRAAVEHYDSALRWSPFDAAIRLERDVVRAVLDAPSRAEFSSPGAPDDLRSAGLDAYLRGDVESALRSWERFELGLDPAAANDPLVETGLGILYLVREEGARAYPRLRDACQAFPNVGFLTSYLADAAVRCGDHEVAERLLAVAAQMPRQDPQLALNRIRAGLLAARGQDAEAEALYRGTQPGTPANLHHARFLHARGRVEEALDQYVLAASAMRGEKVLAEYARVLDGWWAEFGPEERRRRIHESVGLSPWDPRSLVARLRYYARGAESEEPLQAPPARALESLGLAELSRVLDVENTAHWSGIQEYPPLLVFAARRALESPLRDALSRIVGRLAAAYEFVRGRGAEVRDASPLPSVSACPDAPCFHGLGELPGREVSSWAACLSADGSTVGGSAGDRYESREPFVWRAETGMVLLGRGVGPVWDLSGNGSVAVGYTVPTNVEQAFRWTRSDGLVGLDTSDSEATQALSVSDDGLLVAGQSCAERWREASTWSPDRGWAPLEAGIEFVGVVTSLSRDGRWAAGYVQSLIDAPVQAARWSLTGGEKVVAARESMALDVSDDGTVVGVFQREAPRREGGLHEAMYWTGAEPARSLGDLPVGTLDSGASAILRDGTWIAGHVDSGSGHEAVLWDEHRRLHRVKDLLDASGASVPSGWRLEICAGITRNGDLITICGSGTNPAGDPEAWVARFRVARSVSQSTPPDER